MGRARVGAGQQATPAERQEEWGSALTTLCFLTLPPAIRQPSRRTGCPSSGGLPRRREAQSRRRLIEYRRLADALTRRVVAGRSLSEPSQKPVVIGMAADPEPRDFTLLKQPNCSVPKGDAHRVDRFAGVNLLELQAGMVRVLSKKAGRLSSPHRARAREARGTPPRNAECRANSQAVGIDVGRTTSGSVGAPLSGEPAKCVLRGVERASPLLLVR